jgi:hypothetical protein
MCVHLFSYLARPDSRGREGPASPRSDEKYADGSPACSALPTPRISRFCGKLDVQMQSRLIVYHGGKETGRLTGATDPAVIKRLFETSAS